MKRLICIMMILSGCATVSVKTSTPEGKLCEAVGYTLFLDINAAAISACGAKASQLASSVNAEILKDALSLAVKAASAATMP